MANQHPISPPPRMVQDWVERFAADRQCVPEQVYIANRAAQWGADEELEACCEWLKDESCFEYLSKDLRAARRPRPPSLKEQALAKTTAILSDPSRALLIEVRETLELNLRALEALPDE